MRTTRINPRNTQFVLLSFEGPDRYSMAGGLGVRVTNLATTLADMGFVTHLFFVGDPKLPGEAQLVGGRLILHRWCQWISEYYPSGVYQGENEKLYDFNKSIPGFIKEQIILPAVADSKLTVILGEEWHTAEAICQLHDLLVSSGVRDQSIIFWNAQQHLLILPNPTGAIESSSDRDNGESLHEAQALGDRIESSGYS